MHTRVAAIYDVHGNLPALEAVLREIRQESVDLLVVGGDVIPGPMPRETLTCLLDLEIPARFLQGNGECDVLAEIAGAEINHVPDLGVRGMPGSVGEFGWGGAYHSTYWVDPKERLVVVYLTQLIPANDLDDHGKLRTLVYQALIDEERR